MYMNKSGVQADSRYRRYTLQFSMVRFYIYHIHDTCTEKKNTWLPTTIMYGLPYKNMCTCIVHVCRVLAAARFYNICHGSDRCVISTDIKKIIGWNIISVSFSITQKNILYQI